MMMRAIHDREQRLAGVSQLLASLDYKQVLKRGFALVKDAQGKLVSEAASIRTGDALTVTFRDSARKVTAT
jgi:exodeoxyribonuclease VII large subunit